MNKKTLITLLFSLFLPALLFAQTTQQYPVKIDDYLTLTNIIRGDTVTTIEFTVKNIAHLDTTLKEDLKRDIVDGYIVNICEDPRVLEVINKGHLIQTHYRDENNYLLASIAVNQSTCAAR